MKYYRRAEETAHKLLEAFRAGNVPRPLAHTFVHRERPMARWSAGNRFLCALGGCSDARGYRQWKQVGRYVRPGQRAAAHILIPMQKKIFEEDPATGDEELVATVIYGFTTSPVFDVSQTAGDPLPYEEEDARILRSLPLLHYARSLGLEVQVVGIEETRDAAGYYRPFARTIGLATENVATWLHELMHATEHERGLLCGDRQREEIVAELGGATLAILLGEETAADAGGAWSYIHSYAGDEAQAIRLCTELLERVAGNIQFILEKARELDPGQEVTHV